MGVVVTNHAKDDDDCLLLWRLKSLFFVTVQKVFFGANLGDTGTYGAARGKGRKNVIAASLENVRSVGAGYPH